LRSYNFLSAFRPAVLLAARPSHGRSSTGSREIGQRMNGISRKDFG
jgi:hypothetical protein